MLLAGDEIGRTQKGNNNAYCQDNPISWLSWSDIDEQLHEFTRSLIALRLAHPVFARRRWFEGRSIRGSDLTDIGWFKPDGTEMTDRDWNVAFARALGVFLNGEGLGPVGRRGEIVVDDSFLVFFNAGFSSIDFVVPHALNHEPWRLVLDTTHGFVGDRTRGLSSGDRVTVDAHELVVLTRPRAR
jgi:glycogen operon protein